MTPGILSLDEPAEPETVGAKAHTLGRLRRSGFDVPDGFVLTPAFPTPEPPAPARSPNGTGSSNGTRTPSPAWSSNGARTPNGTPTPNGARSPRAELAAACRGWIDPDPAVAVAVRSSAAAEDGSSHSYAGQFVSVLDVMGADAVATAVARCRASASGVRAERYHRRLNGGKGDTPDGASNSAAGMPVVVQRMVYPEWAGVLFSVDPVRPDPAVLVVEAAARSAASVCDGAVTPLRYRVDRVSLTVLDGPGTGTGTGWPGIGVGPAGAPDAGLIAEVARTGLALERVLGGPQDVEWAALPGGGATVTVLQSRAITTLPTAPRRGPSSVAEALSWL